MVLGGEITEKVKSTKGQLVFQSFRGGRLGRGGAIGTYVNGSTWRKTRSFG